MLDPLARKGYRFKGRATVTTAEKRSSMASNGCERSTSASSDASTRPSSSNYRDRFAGHAERLLGES